MKCKAPTFLILCLFVYFYVRERERVAGEWKGKAPLIYLLFVKVGGERVDGQVIDNHLIQANSSLIQSYIKELFLG
ncbi:hypothetical protein E1A91_D11G138300v1 [Gossypium mustelinum]|uniref:Uncharacterized protein n=1 Tax=Gossypium mustelinum TaxID=34275 RepID=A0A5D2SRV7_GOSMU|nr:hypothetical protein E1A91_D11G138300v1 [Gossypium mustelinum]